MFLCFYGFFFKRKFFTEKWKNHRGLFEIEGIVGSLIFVKDFSFSFSYFFIIVHGVRFIVLFVFILFKDFIFIYF